MRLWCESSATIVLFLQPTWKTAMFLGSPAEKAAKVAAMETVRPRLVPREMEAAADVLASTNLLIGSPLLYLI